MSDPTLRAPTGPRAMQGLSIKGRARLISDEHDHGASVNGTPAPSMVINDFEQNKPKALVRHTVPAKSRRIDSPAVPHRDRRTESGHSSGSRDARPFRDDRDERARRDDSNRDDKDVRQSADARSTYLEEAHISRRRRSSEATQQRTESREQHAHGSRRERSRTPEDRHRSHRDRRDSKSSSKHRRPSDSYRRTDASGSDTDSSSESNDSEDQEEERRRKRKKRKKRKEKERRREERERDLISQERRRRKKEKERRSSKDDKGKTKSTAASTGSWGKYGVISDSDLSRMTFEFRAWLVEERRLNPDTIPRDKEKKEFSIFVEDFNTATLPHEKYYNMAAHQAKMAIIRNGGVMAEEPKYDPRADEKAHIARLRATHLPDESDLTREEIVELRRLEKERIEAAKRRQLGLEVPKNLGVRMEEKQRELWQDPNLFHS